MSVADMSNKWRVVPASRVEPNDWPKTKCDWVLMGKRFWIGVDDHSNATDIAEMLNERQEALDELAKTRPVIEAIEWAAAYIEDKRKAAERSKAL